MNIVVTVKQVLDPSIGPRDLRVDESGRSVYAPVGDTLLMNGYDENALEEGLRLCEDHGGQVTVITVGGDSSIDVLRRAQAMGAKSVVLLKDDAWAERDSGATAAILAAAVKKGGPPDLVLCGRQASDTDAGQVLHHLAEALGYPLVTPVSKIEEVQERSVVVRRLADSGYQVVWVELPAVLGVSSEMNEPRYPTAKGLIASKRGMIPSWSGADLDLRPISPKVKLKEVRIPVATARAQLIEGASGEEMGAALADKMHELGLI